MPEETAGGITWRDWLIPLSCEDLTLGEALKSAEELQAQSVDIPFIVKLMENPKFSLPGFTLFNGAVDLFTHDCIHILLGRGMLPKDEAFTIGFTMGSTNKMSTTEKSLFSWVAKYIYPNNYSFNDEDAHIFRDAAHLGFVSDCKPLNDIDFKKYLHMTLKEVRKELGIEVDLLLACYAIHRKRYPQCKASNRVLN
ncbi:MAG: ubiquinone biosynthesis protein COQ4 [Lentisphaeraceae bacterium]|nr:ubiquinone biosynthesis protein COQ4 [Lentisphaeraceae bacterium]